MTKSDEIEFPDSCWNRARDDELVFVLLGRDAAAPETIRFWARLRKKLGLNTDYSDQIMSARALALLMERSGKK